MCMHTVVSFVLLTILNEPIQTDTYMSAGASNLRFSRRLVPKLNPLCISMPYPFFFFFHLINFCIQVISFYLHTHTHKHTQGGAMHDQDYYVADRDEIPEVNPQLQALISTTVPIPPETEPKQLINASQLQHAVNHSMDQIVNPMLQKKQEYEQVPAKIDTSIEAFKHWEKKIHRLQPGYFDSQYSNSCPSFVLAPTTKKPEKNCLEQRE